jgi:NAD(P)-dependent dehydrogenase (short-subunit alcohol dehydrogenase family)
MILENKIVIVSGIGPGLGQELAYGAAREGAKLVIAARSTELLNKLQDEITQSGSEVVAIPCDITKPEDCENLVNKTIKKYGRIDALINSAYRAGDFKEICDSNFTDWQETMNTNFFGTMNLTMATVKKMESNKSAAIVMINSLITKKPLPTQGGYAASKGALSTATKILAKELGPKGIRVNSVFMGWMWGPPVEMYINFTAESMGVKPQDIIDDVTKDIPLGIIPDDSDCANAALFLISDLAKVITGANLDVNGGEFMS